MRSYDIAILGGGPGGYTAALRGAQRGASVCLIERSALGADQPDAGPLAIFDERAVGPAESMERDDVGRQVREAGVAGTAALSAEQEQATLLASPRRPLGDAVRREFVVVVGEGGAHARSSKRSPGPPFSRAGGSRPRCS